SYVQGASDVAMARVVDQRDAVLPTGMLCTEYTAQVSQAVKGAPSQVIKVRVAGGHSSDQDVVVPGAPSFAIGETVLLFLQHYQDNTGDWYGVLGLSDGVYRVQPWSQDDLGTVSGRHAPSGTPMVEFLGRIVDEAAKQGHSGR